MKITALSRQRRENTRINIFVDGKYQLSLDESQIIELNICRGLEIDKDFLSKLVQESDFGKVYIKALNYCMIRPRSSREVEQYLTKKQVEPALRLRVLDKLTSKGYLNDEYFSSYWLENRMLKKGISRRRLVYELKQKGLSSELINKAFENSQRDDYSELDKIIEKKKTKYPADKLLAYLVRQGFDYSLVKQKIDQLEGSDISV